ncbi:MAG: AAA family ATPase [Candidatus Binataceae bacterium]
MLCKIRVQNFMSLRDVSVELDPLTVFWGRNGSGKSAIFKALVTLTRMNSDHPAPVRSNKDFNLEAGITLDDLVWRGDSGRPIRLEVWFDDAPLDKVPGYSLELAKGRAGWSVTYERIRIGGKEILVDQNHPFSHPTERVGTQTTEVPMRGTLRSMVNRFVRDEQALSVIEPILENSKRLGEAWRYRPSAYDIAAFTSGREHSDPFVLPNGRGLALVLQDLQGRQRDVFEKVERQVCKTFEHVRNIGFDPGPDGVRLSFMTTRSNKLVAAPQESDGVLLATFLSWRLYSAEPPITICLEEPENGFYPEVLDERFKLLRSFAVPDDRSPARAQILVSTHSLEFLGVLRQHHSDFAIVRTVEYLNDHDGTCVESLKGYRQAAHLMEYVRDGDSVLPSKWRSG